MEQNKIDTTLSKDVLSQELKNGTSEPDIKIGKRISRRVRLIGIFLGILAAIMVFFTAHATREWALNFRSKPRITDQFSGFDLKQLEKSLTKSTKKVLMLRKKNKQLIPRQPYLIVDTSNHHFYLMYAGKLVREGMCSTGSYTLLQTEDQRKWIFKTPRGMFRIQNKNEVPLWKKPDWAFVEEGLPIPAPDAEERFEAGVLGEYALALGQGYLIHGTLYKRYLGMPVTHGCIRLGDEDLSSVYKNLQINSRVYIY